MNEFIEKAQNIIKYAKDVVIFTGAGMSTESGIPDFRSPGGLWTRFNPDVYANYFYFLKQPELYWEMEREVTTLVERARPNNGHSAIAEFEKTGKLRAIITQNVDFLHQRAGSKVPIYELHGSGYTASCIKCKNTYTRQELLQKMESEPIPKCEKCGNLVKPDVVLFNESLPSHNVDGATEVSQNCDCFIVIGSSLLVFPANQFPYLAKRSGAKIIVVNLEPTGSESLADVAIHGKAGEILPKILNFE